MGSKRELSSDGELEDGFGQAFDLSEPEVEEWVTVVHLRPVRLKISLPVAGAVEFDGAGAEMQVTQADADYLLNLRPGRSCCSGQPPGPRFEVRR